MQGSAIVSGNTSRGGGGGIYNTGTFTMQGNATVSGNISSSSGNGGGIYVNFAGKFTMQDNVKVSGNQANNGSGGGVYVSARNRNSRSGGFEYNSGTTFIMRSNASVSGNTSRKDGGGVYIEGGDFTIQDNATVSGNTATNGNGGGVSIDEEGKDVTVFTKKGGTIYGSDETDTKLRNNAKQGNAIYNTNQWRNATAGPSTNPGTFGFWLNEEEVVQSNTASPSAGNVTSAPPDVTVFPASLRGTWKMFRPSGSVTLTFDKDSIKVSGYGQYPWKLITVSGDSYIIRSEWYKGTERGTQDITLTINFNHNDIMKYDELVIRCNDNNLLRPWDYWNWNTTWRK
jgi:predicted outer membrane repeat protein